MPPKGSRKRARSPSSATSKTASRSRSRSHSPVSATTSSASPLLRRSSEWQELYDRAVLAMAPTPAMLAHCTQHTNATPTSSASRCIKVAAFDLDDTVIMPKTGKVFPKDDPDDWKWLTPQVPEYLRALHERGFLLVLLSNQSGVYGKGTWNTAKADALKEKVVRVGAAAQVPFSCFFSTQSASQWRKPNTGLWGALQEAIEQAMPPTSSSPSSFLDCHSGAFYVGDAAGRRLTTLAGRKKDFSCSDRALAVNLSLPFFTPEQFFLSPLSDVLTDGADSRLSAQWASRVHSEEAASVEVHWDTVSPAELRAMPTSYDNLTITQITPNSATTLTTGAPASFARSGTQEMVIFVGYPGSGKSTFFRRFFQPHGYVHVNRDTLKTKEKCFALAQSCWKGGKSVVIDNTNPSAADRAYFSRIVADASPGRAGAVRVFEFVASRGMATHMSAVRSRLGIGSAIPTIVYNMFQSKHEPVNTPEQVKKENLAAAVLIPPVADFEGLPPAVKRSYFIL